MQINHIFLSLLGLSHAARFVSYVGQAGPGWGNPGTNEDFLRYIGVPGYSTLVGDNGYNVINFAFWVSNSVNGGAAVNGAAFDWQNIVNRITSTSLRQTLTGKSSPSAAELRAGIKSLYASHGVQLCISAFGGADHPMGNGANAVTVGAQLAQYAIDYDFDCVDVDWEEAFYGYFGASAGGEQWLCDITTSLRANLHSDMAISHAPQAPYFMGAPQYPNGGYATVHQNCGDAIDWYNVQFYNQGSSTYDSYTALFVTSNGWSANTAVYQIMDGASTENVRVPAEKLVVGKHTIGDGSTFVDGPTLKSIFNSALSAGRWSAGFMSWQLYREEVSTSKLITEVRAANWSPINAVTPSPTPQPTPSPVSVGGGGGGGGITVTVVQGGAWYIMLSVSGVPTGVTINSVEMRSHGSSNWVTGTFQSWDGNYQFAANTAPLSFRFTDSAGNTLTATDLLSSNAAGTSGTTTGSFASPFTMEDDEGDEVVAWKEWAMVAVCVVVAMVAIVALCLCVRRKRSRSVQFFEDVDAAVTTAGAEQTVQMEEMEEVDQPMTGSAVV